MKALPWGFYLDVLCLVGTGAGLLLGFLLGSINVIVYHAAIGFIITWHLGEVIRKISLETANEHKEPKAND